MHIKDLLFWRYHKVVIRHHDDIKIVVKFNALTGRWRDARYYRDGKFVAVTRNPDVMRMWITRRD